MIATVWDSENLDDEKGVEEKEACLEDGDGEGDREDGADREALSEDGGSSVEEPYVTADEGYEADVEVLETGRGRRYVEAGPQAACRIVVFMCVVGCEGCLFRRIRSHRRRRPATPSRRPRMRPRSMRDHSDVPVPTRSSIRNSAF